MLHRTFFTNPDVDEITTAGLAHHMALMSLNKYFKQFKPSKVFMVFDRPSWRKDYTLSNDCYSKRIYKGERRKDMTPTQQLRYEAFLGHVAEFERLMTEYTSVVCLACKKLEADDLISGLVQKYSETHKLVIISSDKDFLQLLWNDNTTLIDPNTDKPRTLEEWNNDPSLFLFEKCFRGERGKSKDNIESAYPNIRATKIRQAYEDPYIFENIMRDVWIHADKREMSVSTLFKENMLLMDLLSQPEDIKGLIDQTIEEGMKNTGVFSFFHFKKFCGKYELKKISENVEQYMTMLSR